MASSGDKLGAPEPNPKAEKRKSLRLVLGREDSSGKEKDKKDKDKDKAAAKEKEKKDKDKHKEKDKKEKEKEKDKKEKEKEKDKDKKASPSLARTSTSGSSSNLTGKDKKTLIRESSSGSAGSEGKKDKSSSKGTLSKLGTTRRSKAEPMPDHAKLMEMWNQLMVRKKRRKSHLLSPPETVFSFLGESNSRFGRVIRDSNCRRPFPPLPVAFVRPFHSQYRHKNPGYQHLPLPMQCVTFGR